MPLWIFIPHSWKYWFRSFFKFQLYNLPIITIVSSNLHECMLYVYVIIEVVVNYLFWYLVNWSCLHFLLWELLYAFLYSMLITHSNVLEYSVEVRTDYLLIYIKLLLNFLYGVIKKFHYYPIYICSFCITFSLISSLYIFLYLN